MGNRRKLVQSRRDFLKSSTFIGGGVLAASMINPFNAIILAADKPENPDMPWWGYVIDLDNCIGCGRCADACKNENNVSREPFYFRTWVEQYTITNDGDIRVESPNGGIDGFTQSTPEEDIFKTFFVPKMCNHCYKSPCVQVCPVGATFETEDGVVLVDQDYCIGCSYCIQACPYGCRYLHPEKKVADKCTFCYHRISEGMAPACVEVCPKHARMYGNLNDQSGPIFEFLKTHNCLVLKPHLNTGSKLFYNNLNAEVR